MALPITLYSTSQVRALDAHAIDVQGIPGYTLMRRAGEAALRYLRTRWPIAHRIVIVCGGGNNGGGGDGLPRFARGARRTHHGVWAGPPPPPPRRPRARVRRLHKNERTAPPH